MDLEASFFPWLRLGVIWQQGSFNPCRARWTSKAGKAQVTASGMQKLQLLSCRMPQTKATVKDSKCLMVHLVFWRKMLRFPDADMEYDVRFETQSVLSTLSQDDMIPRVEMDRMISCVEVWTYIMHWITVWSPQMIHFYISAPSQQNVDFGQGWVHRRKSKSHSKGRRLQKAEEESQDVTVDFTVDWCQGRDVPAKS